MNLTITKTIDKDGRTVFSLKSEGREEMNISFLEDVLNTYSSSAQAIAMNVLGLLEKENPKTENREEIRS